MADPKVTSEKPAGAAAKVDVLDPCVNVEAGKKAECAEYDKYCQAQGSKFVLKAANTQPYYFSSKKICRLAAEYMVRWYGKADTKYMTDILEGKIKPEAEPDPEGKPAPTEKPRPSGVADVSACVAKPTKLTRFKQRRGVFYITAVRKGESKKYDGIRSGYIAAAYSTYKAKKAGADRAGRAEAYREFEKKVIEELCKIDAEKHSDLVEDSASRIEAMKKKR